MKLGLVSDIHEDIVRLREALGVLASRRCDGIACLGDLVGYSVPYCGFLASRSGPDVVSLVQRHCDIVVVGNHDLYAIKRIPQHPAGFDYPAQWYALDYWERRARGVDGLWLYERDELPALLRKSDESFIASLPEFVTDKVGGVQVMFSHHAFPDVAGTLRPVMHPDGAQEHLSFMAEHRCLVGFSGHGHVEGARLFTRQGMRECGFGTVAIDPDVPTWIHGPAVVNGTFANGVMVFDTNNFELEVIPLGTEKHIAPSWSAL